MGYHVAYVSPDGKPTDGEQVASGRGWLHWGDYALARAGEFPEAAHLAQEGWLDWEEGSEPDDLEHELERLTHADDPDVAAVSATLLSALRSRPPGTAGVLVTDGSEPGDEGEDE